MNFDVYACIAIRLVVCRSNEEIGGAVVSEPRGYSLRCLTKANKCRPDVKPNYLYIWCCCHQLVASASAFYCLTTEQVFVLSMYCYVVFHWFPGNYPGAKKKSYNLSCQKYILTRVLERYIQVREGWFSWCPLKSHRILHTNLESRLNDGRLATDATGHHQR